MLDTAVLAQLKALLPAEALLTDEEDTRPYECDGLTIYRERPSAVVLPETEAHIQTSPCPRDQPPPRL